MPAVDFEVAPGCRVLIYISSVVIDNILHLFVLCAKEVQRVVADEEIVTGRYGLECEFRQFILALFVGKVCVGAIGAPRVQALDTIRLE